MFPRRIQRTKKPEGPSNINGSNPITKGLKVALIPNEGGGLIVRNLVGIGNAVDGGGDGEWGINKKGRYWAAPDSTFAASALTLTKQPFSGAQSRTVITGINQTTTPSNNQVICNTGVSGTGARWSFKYNTTGSSELRIEIQGSGYTSSLIPSNDYHVIGICFEGTQLQDHRLFLDGIFEQASGATSVNTGVNGYEINHNTLLGVSRNDSEIEYHYVWDRKLSDAEILSIEANPYQILQPRTQLLPLTVGVAPPADTYGVRYYQTLMTG